MAPGRRALLAVLAIAAASLWWQLRAGSAARPPPPPAHDHGRGHAHGARFPRGRNATAWLAGAFSARALLLDGGDEAPACMVVLPPERYAAPAGLPAAHLCKAPQFAWLAWPRRAAAAAAVRARAACSPALALWAQGVRAVHPESARAEARAPLAAAERALLDDAAADVLEPREGAVGRFLTVRFHPAGRGAPAALRLTVSDVEALAAAQAASGLLAAVDGGEEYGAEPRRQVLPASPRRTAGALDVAVPFDPRLAAAEVRAVLAAPAAERALAGLARLLAAAADELPVRVDVFCGGELNMLLRPDSRAGEPRRAAADARHRALAAAGRAPHAGARELNVLMFMPDSMARAMMRPLFPQLTGQLRALDAAGPAASGAHVTEFFRFNLAGCCTRSNMPPLMGGCEPVAAVMKKGTGANGTSIYSPCRGGSGWLPQVMERTYGAATAHLAYRNEFNGGSPLANAGGWSAVHRTWTRGAPVTGEIRPAERKKECLHGGPPDDCPPAALRRTCEAREDLNCTIKFDPIPGEGKRHCMSGSSATDMLFEGLRFLWDREAGRPRFAFLHSHSSHAETFAPHLAIDDAAAGFLRDYLLEGGGGDSGGGGQLRWRSDTAFILVADHGPNVGGRASSPWGRRERQLPAAAVVLPAWLAEYVPAGAARSIGEALRQNEQRLTSGVDMYELVRRLPALAAEARGEAAGDASVSAELARRPPPRARVPVLDAIPLNRTCADMGVHERFCVCSTWAPLNRSAAEAFLPAIADFVNRQAARSFASELVAPPTPATALGRIGPCHFWAADALRIVDAEVSAARTSASFLEDAMVSISQVVLLHAEATPAALDRVAIHSVVFEAMVTIAANGATAVDNVVRISPYGAETCEKRDLEQLCVCAGEN